MFTLRFTLLLFLFSRFALPVLLLPLVVVVHIHHGRDHRRRWLHARGLHLHHALGGHWKVGTLGTRRNKYLPGLARGRDLTLV